MMNEFFELSKKLNEHLKLNTLPVGVKLFRTVEEMNNCVRRRPNNPIALCQMIGQSRYIGRTLGGTMNELDACALGVAILGFVDYPKDILDGIRFKGLYHKDEEVSKKVFSETPRFKVGSYAGILTSPLHKCPVDPDLVIFFGNSAQMLRLIHGYVWSSGERLTFSSSGEAACADAIIPTMKTRKPSLTIPCNGARILSIVQDSELIMSVATESLNAIIEGMKSTHKGGIHYPPTFQMTYVTPQPPVSHFIGSKGPKAADK